MLYIYIYIYIKTKYIYVYILALAFSVYHALKNQCSHLVEVFALTQDFAPIRSLATNLAVMYAHDLGILRAVRPGLRCLLTAGD